MLKQLALDNNEIGDTGASALFSALTPGEDPEAKVCAELKQLTLANNALNDASVSALAGAIGVGALKGCKVVLDGNPATKVTRNAVKKALKKNK